MKPLYLIIAAAMGFVFLTRKKVIETALSTEQDYFIDDLHPKAQPVFRAFIAKVQAMGWNVILTSGYRTFAEQADLKAENASNASPGSSFHNFGLAIDLNIQKGLTMIRKADSKELWLKTGVPQLGKSMGLVWGGDFTSYHDPVHFEYRIKDITSLKALAASQFGSDPRKVEGNKVVV